jgi:hypothetical protein
MRKRTIIAALLMTACSSKPGPKDVVFDFIDAVKSNDSLRVMQLLDIDSYIKMQMAEISPDDSARVLADYRERTIQSLLGEGVVRSRWMRDLIVVNKEEKRDSLAEVEVSFLDQAAGHQLYTKMQLQRQPDKSWRIIYFR